jgi:spore coat protein U-like protein
MRKWKQHITIVSTLVWFARAGGALAAQTTITFAVTATVVASCSLSATPLAFGSSINVLSGSNVDGTSVITATCTNGSAYTIGLNAGTASGATVTTRKMTSGANSLNYALYTDAGRSTNWDNIGGTTVVSGTGTGAGVNHTVYGRIPSGQTTIPAGAYADTITVTIDF